MINKILQGDCLDVMNKMPDNYIDLTVTSPPYDNLRTYNGFVFDFEGIAQELWRVTKPGGVVVWIVNDATIKGSETLTSFKQAICFNDIGFNVHDTMIWKKSNPIPQFPTIKRYTSAFEYMFVLVKGKCNKFNALTEKCKTAGSTVTRKNLSAFAMQSALKPNQENTITKEKKKLTNIWDVGVGSSNKEHPAIFPEKLAEDHILSWSNPGDIVLDPMCGSGTTCKMAIKNNRQYIGIDISEEYCNIARERIEDYSK